jgi:hypothetical protein
MSEESRQGRAWVTTGKRKQRTSRRARRYPGGCERRSGPFEFLLEEFGHAESPDPGESPPLYLVMEHVDLIVSGRILDSRHDPREPWAGPTVTSLWFIAFVLFARPAIMAYRLSRRNAALGTASLLQIRPWSYSHREKARPDWTLPKVEVEEGRVVGAVLVGRSTPGRYSAGTTSATIPTFVRLAETKSVETLSRSIGPLRSENRPA